MSLLVRREDVEVLFNLIGKSTMSFLTSQSLCVLKSWYIGWGWGGGGARTRILALYFADGLNPGAPNEDIVQNHLTQHC